MKPDSQEALKGLIERQSEPSQDPSVLWDGYFARAFFVVDTVGRAAEMKAYMEDRLNRECPDSPRAFVRYLNEPAPSWEALLQERQSKK